MSESSKFEFTFMGKTYVGVKDAKDEFIGLVGSKTPRCNLKKWHDAITEAGAKLPVAVVDAPKRTKRVDAMDEAEFAAWRAPSEPKTPADAIRPEPGDDIKPMPPVRRVPKPD